MLIQDDRTVVVKQISTINFSGNIIPNSWFQEIKLPGGSPDTTAILILSEIIYWYRGYEVKDEDSGETIGHKKKFRADMLQRSYESFSTQFGFKKSTIQAAFKNLRSLGLIRTELRTIIIGSGLRCNNVLFIEPIPKAVLNITITSGGPQGKLGGPPPEKLGEVPKKNLGTNTESTTESTQKNEQAKEQLAPPAKKDPRHNQCFKVAYDSYLNKHRAIPHWSGRDGKQLKSLLRSDHALTIDEFTRRWNEYLKTKDTFHSRQGGSLAYFCTNFDKFIAEIGILHDEQPAESIRQRYTRENADAERRGETATAMPGS